MAIRRLDHLNLMSADVPATRRFYERVLGLEARAAPGQPDMDRAAWIADAAGVPVVHVAADADMRDFGSLGTGPLEGTGRVHHLAFDCEDRAAMLARIEAAGCEARTNDVPEIGLRQIFVRDPNGLLIELNFRERGGEEGTG